MAVLKMNAREFAAYHKKLAENLRPTLLRGIRSGGARAIGYLVERVRTAPPANPAGKGSGGAVNTGNLAAGFRADSIPDGVVLRNVRSYFSTVDGGRRASSKMPPKAVIVAWLIRRLGWTKKRAEAGWFAVARSIARRGLLPRKILTAEEAQAQISHLCHEEMVRELEAEMGKKT